MEVVQPTQIVLDFLEQQNFYHAKIVLEKESHIKLRNFGREIDFVYDLITDGLFKDVLDCLQPLAKRLDFQHTSVVYEIKKQALLEDLETSKTPNTEKWVRDLRDIQKYWSAAEFQNLWGLLDLESITDNEEYADWGVYSGRNDCFNVCLEHLKVIYPYPEEKKTKTTLKNLISAAEGGSRPPAVQRPISYSEEKDRSKKPAKSKKSVSWNMTPEEVEETVQPEDQVKHESPDTRELMIDNLSIEMTDRVPSEEEIETSLVENETEEDGNFKTTTEIMNSFDPLKVRELASVRDSHPLRTSCFNPDGDYFALGTNSKTVKICSMHNIVDELLYNQHQGREQQIDVVFEYRNIHAGSVYWLDWSRNNKFIASGSNDRNIRVIKCMDYLSLQENCTEPVVVENGKYLNCDATSSMPEVNDYTLWGHSATVRTLCFNPLEDHILLSGGISNSTIHVWDLETQQLSSKISANLGSVYSLAAAGDASYFVSVGTDRKIRVIDIRAQSAALTLNADHYAEMNHVALNNSALHLRAQFKSQIASMYLKQTVPYVNSEKLAAVAHCDGAVTIWDITAGKRVSEMFNHRGECRSIEFSCDNAWLTSASFDCTVGMINSQTKEFNRITPHNDRVVSAKWHPYLPIILSTSADKTARILAP